MIFSEVSKFLFFILVGSMIGITFDIFRIIRKCFKTSDLITYIHDILFLLISAEILLTSIFIINNGELRGYILIGIIIGLILYFILLSKHIINISTKIILFLKKLILKPIIKLLKKLYFLAKNLTNFNK